MNFSVWFSIREHGNNYLHKIVFAFWLRHFYFFINKNESTITIESTIIPCRIFLEIFHTKNIRKFKLILFFPQSSYSYIKMFLTYSLVYIPNLKLCDNTQSADLSPHSLEHWFSWFCCYSFLFLGKVNLCAISNGM